MNFHIRTLSSAFALLLLIGLWTGLRAQTLVVRQAHGQEGCRNARAVLLRSGASGTLSFALSYGGTATSGTDYTGNLPAAVSMPPSADSLEILLTPIADGITESTESVTVTVTATTGGNPLTATLFLLNAVTVNAGLDTTVCSGQPVLLGTPGNSTYTYFWSTSLNPSGLSNANIGQPTMQLSPAHTTAVSYNVTATDTTGCTASDNVLVTVVVAPQPSFMIGNTVCEHESTFATYTGPANPAYQYSWNFGPSSTSPAVNLPITPVSWANAGLYPVTLQVTAYGCASTVTNTVLVRPAPQASILNSGNACPNSPVQLNYGLPANAGNTYLWDFDGGSSSSGAVPNPTVAWGTSGPKEISLQVVANGCSSAVALDTVVVHTPPAADAGPDQWICSGISTVIGPPATSNCTYLWSSIMAATGSFGIVPGTETSAQATFGLNNIAQVTYLYTLTATDTTTGCQTTDTLQVTYSVTPNPTFAIPASACTDQVVQATYTNAQPAGIFYVWQVDSPGVTLVYGSSTILASWSVPDTYQVTLTLSHGGCVKSGTHTIVIHPTPSASILDSGNVCVNSAAQLVGSSPANSALAYLWDFDGGTANAATTPVPTVSWSTPGPKEVSLQVVAAGCTSAVAVDTVMVYPEPVASIDSVVNQCLTGNSFTFQASGATQGSSYAWTFGPDASLTSDTSATPAGITFAQPGIKQATLQITQNGCTSVPDTATFEVIAVPIAAIAITGGQLNGVVCAGDTIQTTYTGTIAGPLQTYTWSFQDGTPSTASAATPPPVLFSGSGTKLITLIADHQGCTDTALLSLEINPAPIADAGPDLSFCEGSGGVQPVALISSGTPGYQFIWSDSLPGAGGGLSNPSIPNPVINPLITPSPLTGDSTVSYLLTVVDAAGCTSHTDTLQVTLRAKPRPDAGADLTACQGGPGVFLNGGLSASNTAPGPFSFTWHPGTGLSDSTAATPSANPATTTLYALTATSANGCSSDSPAQDTTATMTLLIAPSPVVHAGPDLALCEGDSVHIYASVTGAGPGTFYAWSVFPPSLITPSSGTTTSVLIPSVTVPAGLTGTATAILVANSGGCSGADTLTISVFAQPALPILSFDNDSTLTVSAANGPAIAQWSWLYGNAPLATTPDSTLHISQNGLYQVIATSTDGCVSDTAALQVLTVQTDGPAALNLRIYPNPTTGMLFLEGATEAAITLFSASGQQVLHADRTTTLDLSGLPAGVYLARIRTTSGTAYTRITKE